MTTWNNELYRTSHGTEGTPYSDICDNVKEGDIWIDGLGGRNVVVSVATGHESRNNGGNWLVRTRPTRKNCDLPHMGMKEESHIFSEMWDAWERI